MNVRYAIALTLASILLSSCGGGSKDAATPTTPARPGPIDLAPNEPIVIGVSVALEGAQGSIGQDLADAVDLAIEDFGQEIQGRPIASRRADDGCNDAETAVAAAKELILANVAAVVGPMCTTGAQAANDEYEDAGVVHITPSASRADLSERGERFFFRTAWRDDAQAAVQAAFLRSERADTAVVVDDGEPYGRALADAFVVAFEAAGGRILSRERLERGSTDFAALARQISAADADAVVYEGLDPEGALLLRDLREEAFEGTFAGPDSLLNEEDFIGTAGSAAEDAILTSGPVPDAAFNERFLARFGRVPSTSFVLQAYDAARLTLTAIETVAVTEGDRVTIDRGELSAALRGSSLAGLTGTLRFGDNGDRTGESARELGLAIFRIADGVFEQVE